MLSEFIQAADPDPVEYIHVPIQRFDHFRSQGYRIACFCNLPGLVLDISDPQHNYIYHFLVWPTQLCQRFKCHRCGQQFVLDFL